MTLGQLNELEGHLDHLTSPSPKVRVAAASALLAAIPEVLQQARVSLLQRKEKVLSDVVTGGEMIMNKEGLAWGVVFSDGPMSACDWVPPSKANVYTDGHITNPTDVTWKGSPTEAELRQGKVCQVMVRRSIWLAPDLTLLPQE